MRRRPTPRPTRRSRSSSQSPALSRCRIAEAADPGVLFRQVRHRLGVVAVWVDHKAHIIIGGASGPTPGLTIVFAAGLHRRGIKGIDRCAGWRDEGHMHRPTLGLALGDPEGRLLTGAEADRTALAAPLLRRY